MLPQSQLIPSHLSDIKSQTLWAVVACILPIGFPLFVLILGQYLGNYVALDSIWSTIQSEPFSGFADHSTFLNCKILFLNWVVLSAFWFPTLLLLRRPRPAIFIFVFAYLSLVIVNALKVKYRSEPIFPWDIAIFFQMLPLAKSYLLSPEVLPGISVLLGLVLSWLAIGKKIATLNRIQSIFIGLIGVICWSILSYVVIVIGPNDHITHSRNVEDPLVNITWSPIQNVKVNLLPLMLAMNVHLMNIHVPANYTENAQQLFPRKSVSFNSSFAKQLGELPDIVIVLSESFFNLNRFPSLHFNEDPTPTFSKEEANYGANVVTPAFGGGTANVEFEILTGLRTALLPNGSIPYMQYIDRALPTTLPNYLKTLGYETIGIHSFDGNFWKRNQVYPLIGIDRFIDQTQFDNPPMRGPFIRDSALAQKILSELNSISDRPKFIFAASMENHGNYVDPNRYAQRKLRSLNAPTKEMQIVLDNYAEGMHDADQSFATLVNAVRQRSRPTLFVFFGDHLSIPLYMLEDANLVSSDYFDSLTQKDRRTIHTTQATLISNEPSVRWPDRRFQMNNMAPEILRAAGIPMSPYWRLIDATCQELPVHIYGYSEDSSGHIKSAPDENSGSYIHTMQLLTYDLLFGDQHLVKRLSGQSPLRYAKNDVVISRDLR